MKTKHKKPYHYGFLCLANSPNLRGIKDIINRITDPTIKRMIPQKNAFFKIKNIKSFKQKKMNIDTQKAIKETLTKNRISL